MNIVQRVGLFTVASHRMKSGGKGLLYPEAIAMGAGNVDLHLPLNPENFRAALGKQLLKLRDDSGVRINKLVIGRNTDRWGCPLLHHQTVGLSATEVKHPEKLIEIAKRALQFGRDYLGLNVVSGHLGLFRCDKPEYSSFLSLAQQLAGVMEDGGGRFIAESGPDSLRDMVQFFTRDLRSDRISIGLDLGNGHMYKAHDPLEVFEKLHDYVDSVHLKGAIPNGTLRRWGTEVPCQSSRARTKMKDAFGMFKHYGWDKEVVVECEMQVPRHIKLQYMAGTMQAARAALLKLE